MDSNDALPVASVPEISISPLVVFTLIEETFEFLISSSPLVVLASREEALHIPISTSPLVEPAFMKPSARHESACISPLVEVTDIFLRIRMMYLYHRWLKPL